MKLGSLRNSMFCQRICYYQGSDREKIYEKIGAQKNLRCEVRVNEKNKEKETRSGQFDFDGVAFL